MSEQSQQQLVDIIEQLESALDALLDEPLKSECETINGYNPLAHADTHIRKAIQELSYSFARPRLKSPAPVK